MEDKKGSAENIVISNEKKEMEKEKLFIKAFKVKNEVGVARQSKSSYPCSGVK